MINLMWGIAIFVMIVGCSSIVVQWRRGERGRGAWALVKSLLLYSLILAVVLCLLFAAGLIL